MSSETAVTFRSSYTGLQDIADRTAERMSMVKLNPTSGSTYYMSGSGTNKVIFNVPNTANQFMDAKNSYLSFKVANGDSNAYTVWDTTVGSLIRSVTVRSGANIIAQVNDFNLLNAFLYSVRPWEHKAGSSAGNGEGAGTQDEKRVILTSGKHMYLPLNEVNVFACDKLIPLPFMGGASSGTAFQLEIEFDFVYTSFVAPSGVTPVITITDVALYMDLVRMTDGYLNQMRQALASGKQLEIQTASWEILHESLSTATDQVLRFSSSKQSAKAIFAIFRLSSGLTSQTTQSLSEWSFPNLKSHVWRMNGKLMPVQPVEYFTSGSTVSEDRLLAWAETQKALGIFSEYDKLPSLPGYSNGSSGKNCQFFIGQNLETFVNDDVISGQDLHIYSMPMELSLSMNTAPSASKVSFLIFYDETIVIGADGTWVRS